MMIGLTLVAVVVAVLHPIAWTDEEMGSPCWRRRPGALVFFAAVAPGRLDTPSRSARSP